MECWIRIQRAVRGRRCRNFSDGKLNTLVKDPNGRNHEVLKRFVEAGAPEEIVYQQKPHLGTDVLIGIVETMRHQIEEMGVLFALKQR